MQSRPKREPQSPEERVWKAGSGPCVMCKRDAFHRHHVIEKQHLKTYAPRRLYDLAGGIWLCEGCHERHTKHFRKVPLRLVPDRAINFAFEVLGDFAPLYLRRYYDCETYEPRLKRRPEHVYD